MIDLGEGLEWTNELEQYLKDIGEKAMGYSILHKDCEAFFSKKAVMIDIPSIVLSTLAGTLSIGSAEIFANIPANANLIIGGISICVGVIQTINSYFGSTKRAENHRISNLQFGKLFRFIQIELSLPRSQRIRVNDLMKIIREQYERLMEMSPLIPTHILDDFKQRYSKYESVSKPSECNGLEEIVIYSEDSNSVILNPNYEIKNYDIKNKNIDSIIQEQRRLSEEDIIENSTILREINRNDAEISAV